MTDTRMDESEASSGLDVELVASRARQTKTIAITTAGLESSPWVHRINMPILGMTARRRRRMIVFGGQGRNRGHMRFPRWILGAARQLGAASDAGTRGGH